MEISFNCGRTAACGLTGVRLSVVRRHKRSADAQSILFCFLILLAPVQALGSDTSTKLAKTIDRQILLNAWSQAYTNLSKFLMSDLQKGRTYVLYETQIKTANLFR